MIAGEIGLLSTFQCRPFLPLSAIYTRMMITNKGGQDVSSISSQSHEMDRIRENAIQCATMQLIADVTTANGSSRESTKSSRDGSYDSHGSTYMRICQYPAKFQ